MSMIKLTFCLRRLPSLSLEEFQDYWLNKHGPLVASHRKALRIQRYVQLHSGDAAMAEALRAARAGSIENAPEIYDGVAQLWWANAEDLAAIEAGRALLEDERKFIDLANSPLWFGEEKVIFG